MRKYLVIVIKIFQYLYIKENLKSFYNQNLHLNSINPFYNRD